MAKALTLALLTMLLTSSHHMIMRNNALMTKMVSQFQGKENSRTPREQRKHDDRSHEKQQERSPRALEINEESFYDDKLEQQKDGTPEHVLSLMQNVLCKNFPSIPCDLIMKDHTLRELIGKSIQQLKYKKMTLDRTTMTPHYQLTLFPVINSEDLSNFLQVSNTGFFKPKKSKKKQQKNPTEKNFWSHETKNKTRTAVINGRKKIRKFYPHKIKYKDKGAKANFHEYSDEKLSMSVETPLEHNANVKRKHFSYRGNPSDPPVWRIDYMKHGEPNLNMFGYESDSLKGKLIKTGPNVVVDDSILEQAARRDVLHPDVYIKKNYPRKNKDSEGLE